MLPIWPVREDRCACGTDCGRTGGKHPIHLLVPQGVRNATTDEATVRAWWARYPDANVGVATGERSGVFVLDVDTSHNGYESLGGLEARNNPLPATLRAMTGSGGMHVYFRWPGQTVRNTVGLLGTGLDVRGDGGYVVAPPSRSLGGEYRWDTQDPVTEAPQWMKTMVTGTVRTDVDPLEVGELMNGIPEGQRDITLFRWACKLRAIGLPVEIAEELVVGGARRCTPPFPEEQARAKVRRVYQQYRVEHRFTDVGNSERLVDRHGEDIRYCRSGYWICWDGARWNQGTGHLVVPLAEETVQSLLAEAAELVGNADDIQQRRDQLIQHAIRSERIERIQAMVRLAESEPRVSITVDDLDKDRMLLNCPNGEVDLRTGNLRPHRRESFMTKMAGAPYNPRARAPGWRTFLERVIPDSRVLDFVHRAVGYSATGRTDEQVMFFLFGSGANGKSTFLRTIQLVLGDYAKQATPDLMMMDRADQHPTGLADLLGARFVPTIEVEEGKRLAEAQVKWMTGGDRMKARYMHKDYFEFDATHKLWLASNHRPTVHGQDGAIWRRILLVPFDVTIPPEERDHRLGERLFGEAEGIMAWVVEGTRLWQDGGLQPPESVRVATEVYRQDMDILGMFLQDCVTMVKDGGVQANDLYFAYSGWCKLAGERALTQRRFSNQLNDMGYNRERGHGNKYVWLDVSLTDAGRDAQSLGLGARPIDVIDSTGGGNHG